MTAEIKTIHARKQLSGIKNAEKNCQLKIIAKICFIVKAT